MANLSPTGKLTGQPDKAEEELNAPEVRAHFSSRYAIILTCLGTVVGTGNIWRFPRVVANNSEDAGGLVFLLVWVLFLFLWSIPMLMVEYGTGRYTQHGVVESFRQFMGDKFSWCGAWVVMVSFMIASYYSVVLGWCFYFFVYYCANSLPENAEESQKIFRDFAQESSWPVLTHAISLILTGLAVVKGVKTIEKVSIALVPLFLFIILFTFLWSLTRNYADKGLAFLFTPSWESFGKPRVWVDALSQNAFDTGAGTGVMIPYSSFMTRTNGVVKYGSLVPTVNNLVSLTAGMTIFATVFSTLITSQASLTQDQIVTILKDSGPASTGLTFIWIPVLFQTVGTFGHVLCVLFFLCLSFAGLTSLISNFEQTAMMLDDFGLSRKFSMPLTALLMYLVGLMSAFNIDILTNQDFVWGFALVLSGLMLQAMVISFGVSNFRMIVINDYGLDDWKLPKIWDYVVKFIAPLEVVLLIFWWAFDLISSESEPGEERWYEFGRETFMVTVVQWLVLLVLLLICNTLVLFFYWRGKSGEKALLMSTASSPHVDNSYTGASKKQSLEIGI